MNPATTVVKSETITNTIAFIEPFILFLGRKKYPIEKLARVEILQQYESLHDEDDPFGPIPPSRIVSERVSLFISDELYATIQIPPRKKYSRRSMKIVKPKRGPMQIHLTKRFTKLTQEQAARKSTTHSDSSPTKICL